MVHSPYTERDLIILEQQYRITNLYTETDEFWIFDAVQVSTQKKVKVKIYINEKFLSDSDVEDTWKREINHLQSEGEYQGEPIEFIESGVKTEFGIKFYIIVFSFSDVSIQPKEMESDRMKASKREHIFPQSAKSSMEKKIEIREEPKLVKPSLETLEELDDSEEIEEIERIKEIEDITSYPTSAPSEPMAPSSPPALKRKTSDFSEREEFVGIEDTEIADEEKKDIPTVMKEKIIEEEKEYVKHISMGYYDRMNPQNYYPLTLSISDIIEATKAPIVNPLTGERKVQQQSKMEVELKDPIVTIRPTIPGCSVVPRELETDFDKSKDEVTFYVTPGVKGKIVGHIKFINEGKLIHTTNFEAKVVDPNFARLVAFYGILASFVPKIISILGINLGLNATLNGLWDIAEGTFGNMTIASLIAVGGIIPVILISLAVRRKLKPTSCRIQYKIADFRFKDIKLRENS
ncbi:MAG: hypothetical protein EAX90_14085 [Candidatus Heimdallarchaeota archaeon]|nr:hypothetical protein [Candidatus Heimdallarchaeota archaeon]